MKLFKLICSVIFGLVLLSSCENCTRNFRYTKWEQVERTSICGIDKQALSFKVDIDYVGNVEFPEAVERNVRLAFINKYITDEDSKDIIKREFHYCNPNCALIGINITYPKK